MENHGTIFEWKAIVDMWQRECTRAESGLMRKVPRLLLSYVERDAWTKLNVAPAKIMQVTRKLISVFVFSCQLLILLFMKQNGSYPGK